MVMHREVVMRTLIACLALLLAASVGRGAQMQTLTGETLQGELVSVTDKEITFNVDGKPVSRPLSEVTFVDLGSTLPQPPKDAKHVAVELTDGSVLYCS